jgi:hypothetical protein
MAVDRQNVVTAWILLDWRPTTDSAIEVQFYFGDLQGPENRNSLSNFTKLLRHCIDSLNKH